MINLGLNDKVALVTAASRGLGKAVALAASYITGVSLLVDGGMYRGAM